MPRGRCHWALLIGVRDALRAGAPDGYAIATTHRAEYIAGGMAPDALRLFAGADKASSHFYDDQRPETWTGIVQAVTNCYPGVAEPRRLSAPAVAWLLGYLTHVMTDVAYWRHVVTKLPPFPEHIGLHHGAWMLADRLPLAADERRLDVDAVRFRDAPPWVQEAPVRRMLERMTQRILPPDGVWPVEVAYHRNRPDAAGKSDDEILAAQLPQWEAFLASAVAALREEQWRLFQDDATAGSVDAIRDYLGQ